MRQGINGIIFFISLVVLANNCFAADGDNQGGRVADDFAQSAMQELKVINSSDLNYAEIEPRVKDYAAAVSKSLSASGLPEETINTLMQKMSGWYGDAVAQIFNGDNYADTISNYSGKISDLFSQEHLDIAAQAPVISLSSSNLEAMRNLLKDIESNY